MRDANLTSDKGLTNPNSAKQQHSSSSALGTRAKQQKRASLPSPNFRFCFGIWGIWNFYDQARDPTGECFTVEQEDLGHTRDERDPPPKQVRSPREHEHALPTTRSRPSHGRTRQRGLLRAERQSASRPARGRARCPLRESAPPGRAALSEASGLHRVRHVGHEIHTS